MSVSRRFWSLVAIILCATMVASAVAIWSTATPYLARNQSEIITSQAEKDARAIEAILAQYEQLLNFVASQENIVSVAIGYVDNPAVVSDYFGTLPHPGGLVSVALLDAFGEVASTDIKDGSLMASARKEMDALSNATLYSDKTEAKTRIQLLRAGRDVQLLMAVPVVNRGFAEGVLAAEINIALKDVFSPNNVVRDTFIGFPPREDFHSQAWNENSKLIAGGQLTLVTIPDFDATAAVGRTLLINVMAAISVVLLVAFTIFAWLGRTTIVRPHQELEEQKNALAELASVAENANDAILVTDLSQRIIWGNPSFEQLSGHLISDIKGLRPGDILQGADSDPTAISELRVAVKKKVPVKAEILNYTKTGQPYWISISITPLARENGEIYGFMAISHDVTLERRQREEIAEANRASEYQARHDALTGLPNRRVLNEELDRRAAATNPEAALLRIDLDHFKNVNDTMGHDAGDFVLQVVANTLRDNTRKADIAARVGGDEFIVLLEPGSTSQDAIEMGRRIRKRLNEQHHFDDKPLRIGASFGVSSTLDGFVPFDEIVSSADAALYRGKELGRNHVVLYDGELHDTVCYNRKVSLNLLRAFENQEFEPFFQPQICAQTGQVSGYEVLARWRCPNLGLVPPDVFLPVADQMSRTEEVDACIFRKGLNVAKEFKSEGIDLPKLSFNVTASRIHQIAADLDLGAQPKGGPKIAFEILESVLVEDQTDMFRFALDTIRERGFLIEIDDFGSGHASVVGLVQIQPDYMKIDQRLVKPILDSQTSANLLRSIVDMGKTINVGIVAEGVETEQHAYMLRDLGCDILQGYHFAKPLPAAELRQFIETYDAQKFGSNSQLIA